MNDKKKEKILRYCKVYKPGLYCGRKKEFEFFESDESYIAYNFDRIIEGEENIIENSISKKTLEIWKLLEIDQKFSDWKKKDNLLGRFHNCLNNFISKQQLENKIKYFKKKRYNIYSFFDLDKELKKI